MKRRKRRAPACLQSGAVSGCAPYDLPAAFVLVELPSLLYGLPGPVFGFS